MGLMTVKAGHALLPQRMVRKKVELGLDIRMAAIAEFRHLFVGHFLLWSFVQFVA